MTCSEAQLAANRSNGAKGRGPVSAAGREASRKNAFKHGLTGGGVVTPGVEREEVAARAEALAGEMKPRSTAGVMLILQMATLSVRMERAGEYEAAAIAKNVRHAAEAFDEERIDRANQLFDALADDPRTNLRRLRKMPEGVDRLIDGWRDLRADLAIEPSPAWTDSQLEQAGHMTGLKSRHARGSRLGELSRGFWGDFAALGELDGGLDDEFRREWARSMLIERIDAEIAALEAHRETLDFATIELDRLEAGARALFDSSKEACLARRYESEAQRGFFKALNEFRKVEAESRADAEAAPIPPTPAPPGPGMGSFREMTPPPRREPAREPVTPVPAPAPAIRRVEDPSTRRTRRPKLPR